MSKNLSTALAPLPRVPAEWVRKAGLERTINDLVEEVHLSLVTDERYINLLSAVGDDEAIEGSLAADNFAAASMIRDHAAKVAITAVAKAKLATINKALGIVLRRYGVSRKERRSMIGGEIIPDGNGE